ncbi:MAG: tetratricopeptide repeat protein [Methylophilus sp.]|nr:tetratricopeptide repeat protein [Methylophilus sp.]
MNKFDYFSGKKQMKLQVMKMAVVLAIGMTALNLVAAESSASNAALKEITLLSDQGNQAAALDKVNAYLSTNPKDAEAMFMKGVILVELGKRDEAIKTFTDLTEKYPNLPEPYNNLAVLYADQGQYDKARKALETAIKTHPSYATAHENLGDIYARLASEAYDKAFKLDTSNARAQSKLSMITNLFGGKSTNVASATSVTSKPVEPVKSTEMTKPADMAKSGGAKPAEVKKPEPAKTATSGDAQVPIADQDAAIIEAVNAWANAWSSQNVNQYLASYAEGFKTPKGESRKSWESMRRERVTAPKSIAVKVSDTNVKMDGEDTAKVSFRQTYTANGKTINTRKTLVMTKVNSAWLILQENAR